MHLNKVQSYIQLMRLNKPIGILLLLWPTLSALWLASGGFPSLKLLFVFISGVVLLRTAGCIINDLADRDFDKQVQRTQTRPLATGAISVHEAMTLCVILLLAALGLALLLNRFTLFLASIGLILATIYPFLKRITHLPQVGLGFTFSWGIPMAFAAQTHTIPATAWLLYMIALLWTIAYDTIYAMTDREDDIKIGIKSTAILFASYDRLIIGSLQLIVISLLFFFGWLLKLGVEYYLAIFLCAIFFGYQQYLIRSRDPKLCFKAFLNNHWAWLVIFLGIFIHFYF
jgi:4-hydroxybenzoate polyprenyltransferase